MLFDLNNYLDREQFKSKVNQLYTKARTNRVVVEVIEKQNRTLSQNKYLHVIIRYLALQTGYSEYYAKQIFFKMQANYDTFFIGWEYDDSAKVRLPKLRHSSDLSESEMSQCIDRFIAWSAQTAGVRLPSPDERDFIRECEIQVEKNKQYL